MEKTFFEEYNSQAERLFSEIKSVLLSSQDEAVRAKSESVPERLYNDEKRVNVVFAGQYSAGKSSLLSILTGRQLAVGGGITTCQCESFEWQGVTVTDTPGIHTQNRPDHDAITYEQIAKADLIVFVLTAEGFSDHLAEHFRKLIIEKGKGHEMMLVVNKMDRTAGGNTPEQQGILIDKDILPVIDPYSVEDMYTSFICTDWYNQAYMPKYEKYQDRLIAKSGIPTLIDNINKFIKDKGLLGTYTTSLYETEKILSELVSNMKTGDAIVDGSIHYLNEQRRILTDAKSRIKEQVGMTVNSNSFQISQWGNDIANQLKSGMKQDEVNAMLGEKQREVEYTTDKLSDQINSIIQAEVSALSKDFKKLEDSEFFRNLNIAITERIKSANISGKTLRAMGSASNTMKDLGTKIANMSVAAGKGKDAMSFLKLSTFSGSDLHKGVLTVGHLFKHKFKPWQAVKWTKNISNGARVLGWAGSALAVFVQIKADKEEDEMEKQLSACRSEIRNVFRDASNVIDLEYNKATDTWIQTNLHPEIEKIDHDIEEINDNIQTNNDLYIKLSELLRKTRKMISDIQADMG